MFRSDKNAGGVINSLRNDHFLNFVAKNLLNSLAKAFEFRLLFLEFLLFFLGLFQIHAFFGAVSQLFAVKLLQLLDHIFINRVNHIKDFITLLFQRLDEGGVLDGLFALTSDEIDLLLAFLHSGHIFLQTDEVITALAGLITE